MILHFGLSDAFDSGPRENCSRQMGSGGEKNGKKSDASTRPKVNGVKNE
jgi:hypothetical protein